MSIASQLPNMCLMIACVVNWLLIFVVLFIGMVGVVLVFKVVYVDKCELKCVCVGGGSNVLFGFVLLMENVFMLCYRDWEW